MLYLNMFEQLIKKIRAIDLEEIALKSLENKKEEAFDLNTESQLFEKGEDSDGNTLGQYAPLSVVLRSEAGLPIDRITTRVTGDFHDGWEGNFVKFPVPFTSSDSKTPDLIALFGVRMFGLTPKSIDTLLDDVLRDEITDNFQKDLSKALASF